MIENIKVCSNYFVFGKFLGDYLYFELWLNGYDIEEIYSEEILRILEFLINVDV